MSNKAFEHKAFEDYYRDLGTMEQKISKEFGCSEACARDILYLRTRHRHTPELETQLIQLHEAGTPPNMMEFGVTEQTQQNLINEVLKNLPNE